MVALPMFPLGAVLVPSMPLPLHVFEPRYQQLVKDCLAGDGEFGVVLIERGSEVGGGDVRSDVGTVARIVETAELGDGRWALGTVGVRRLRVLEWLADDPYPRAEVQDWPDPEPGPGHDVALATCTGLMRQVLGKASELGIRTAPATIDLADDPVLAGYQAGAVAPIGPFDQQRLLAAPTPAERLALLEELLRDALSLIEARLGQG